MAPRVTHAHRTHAITLTTIALAALAAFAQESYASFPGRNGRIAFEHDGALFDIGKSGHGRRRLTPATREYDSPSYSPDGRSLVVENDDDSSVAVMDAHSGRRRQFAGDLNAFEPSFAPGGSRVIVAPGWGPLMTLNVRTGQDRRRLANARGAEPVLSVRGQLAYTRVLQEATDGECGEPGDPALTDVYVANADGTSRRRVTKTFGSQHPDWSPNGKKLLFTRDPSLDRSDVLQARPDVSAADCAHPVWRSAADDTAPEIYVMNANGSAKRRLALNADSAVWSPDGRKIAFVRDGWVHTMKTDGTHVRRLARGSSPSWQPVR
jgi:Tol biopolymer transport system component